MEDFGTPSRSLQDLPEELIQQICEDLSVRDLNTLRLTNKSFSVSVVNYFPQRFKKIKQTISDKRERFKRRVEGAGWLRVGAKLNSAHFGVHREGSDSELMATSMATCCNVLAYWAIRFNSTVLSHKHTNTFPNVWTTFRTVGDQLRLYVIIEGEDTLACKQLVSDFRLSISLGSANIQGFDDIDVRIIAKPEETTDILCDILEEGILCVGFSSVDDNVQNASCIQRFESLSKSPFGKLVHVQGLNGICFSVTGSRGSALPGGWQSRLKNLLDNSVRKPSTTLIKLRGI